MSLRLVESPKEIRSAQQQLVKCLALQLPSRGKQWVTFRPSSAELEIFGKGNNRLYVGSRTIRDERKFWNAFGIYDSTRQKQEITVEINFSLDGDRTAGFFAQDGGRCFLLHSGGIGGGKEGVSQASFLAWAKPELVVVEVEAGKVRHGMSCAARATPSSSLSTPTSPAIRRAARRTPPSSAR